ncbi:GIY-YIG nuclease family protein [Oceanicella sp. SM1341]|uniref:GIY-YIG nuclease family protein n=1 Tax=Oceanicella sp. SM1341 TaxID=1548889 RepID=UPI000E49C5DB|nr:GIY-YIG nuclease family protein [Oceanicella sp. SM1341]
MVLTLNTILRGAGVNPSAARLVRHRDKTAVRGREPYDLWRDAPEAFVEYQSVQANRRKSLHGALWVVFVVTPQEDTLFAGLWAGVFTGMNSVPYRQVHRDVYDATGTVEMYDLTVDDRLDDLRGRLVIDWGAGTRSWIQYADRREKPVLELRRRFREPDFPGFLSFQEPLSRIPVLPPPWRAVLQMARGVYLLTCPRTREQYVGSATGGDGFLGRWQNYAANAHGGNVGLKSREPADYMVSILEVAGTSASHDEILARETMWKLKLRSREMGLNKN